MKSPLLTIVMVTGLVSAAFARNTPTSSIDSPGSDSQAKRLWISRFQLGISVGGMYNSMIDREQSNWGPPFTVPLPPTRSSPTLCFKGVYTGKHWRYGVSVQNGGLTARARVYINPDPIRGHLAQSSSPTVLSKIFVDRALTWGKREIYCGATWGAFVYNPGARSLTDVWNRFVNSYCAGLQTGLTYHITEVVHFNAQLTADYVYTDPDFFIYSATVGLRFSVHYRTRG